MSIDVKTTPKPDTSEVELTITVPPTDFSPYIDRAAKKLSKDAPIKGFRPGKITPTLAFESYGKERVLHEALDLA
ncbi:MAG: trigger factor family protein, partial [Candidatus Andersenbacteria bacterium]